MSTAPRVINPWTWQEKYGYVQAKEVPGTSRVLWCAGQTSIDADGNVVHAGDMEAQFHQALDNLETVLGEAGLALSDVVRFNYYTTDVDGLFSIFEGVTARLATAGCRAASTLLGVNRLAFPELLVEIEATAVAS
jgi:enamine deaminase RidA (YjgF/YER057c/UK114 family)